MKILMLLSVIMVDILEIIFQGITILAGIGGVVMMLFTRNYDMSTQMLETAVASALVCLFSFKYREIIMRVLSKMNDIDETETDHVSEKDDNPDEE